MNPILEYNEKIKNKEIIVSKKVAKIYNYLSEIISGKIESNYYFDETYDINTYSIDEIKGFFNGRNTNNK